MENSVFINLEETILAGDILDIGGDNYGIIYNLFKNFDEHGEIDYIEKGEKIEIKEKKYDNCVLFFSLSSIMNIIEKKRLIDEINCYLKDDGLLYIWDMDKEVLKPYEKKLRVYMPDKTLKEIHIKDTNLLKQSNIKKTLSLLEKDFKILNCKSGSEIYYIMCKKRRNN
ncbi:MAG: class I SAM-dependent methyltransferase [Clostridium sp.]